MRTLQIAGLIALLTLTGSGLAADQLAPCPDSPNCVSSQAGNADQRIEALHYTGDAGTANKRLLTVLKNMDRTTIKNADARSIHAEVRSAFFGFVDDLTFYFDAPSVIQVRSASRVGYADFGVNRQRVEEIRTRFNSTAGSAL
jgi:uncharacterized protein (DUF1499 family)